jgi:poly(A) polymerase
VPISRLFDEMVKLMQTGHALSSIEQLKRYGLVGSGPGVFPVLDAALAPSKPSPAREKFVRLALQDTDARVGEGRAVVPSFMLACMLWHDVQERWSALLADGEAPFPALQMAVDAVFDARIGDISGRGKLAADMREIWLMQPRFERRTSASAHSLVAQARFRAGYDFLRLRADCGDVPPELADWWEDFHLGDDDEREALLLDVRASAATHTRRTPGSAGPVGAAPSIPSKGEATDDETDVSADHAPANLEGDASPATRKRRRRRRKPGGGGSPGAAGGEGVGSPAE